jgi:hypothetical protein
MYNPVERPEQTLLITDAEILDAKRGRALKCAFYVFCERSAGDSQI